VHGGGIDKIQEFYYLYCEKPLFGGFLGFSEEEKGPQMENMENFIYSTFCILINPENFGLVKFF
jgi:hypothetical protein